MEEVYWRSWGWQNFFFWLMDIFRQVIIIGMKFLQVLKRFGGHRGRCWVGSNKIGGTICIRCVVVGRELLPKRFGGNQERCSAGRKCRTTRQCRRRLSTSLWTTTVEGNPTWSRRWRAFSIFTLCCSSKKRDGNDSSRQISIMIERWMKELKLLKSCV